MLHLQVNSHAKRGNWRKIVGYPEHLNKNKEMIIPHKFEDNFTILDKTKEFEKTVDRWSKEQHWLNENRIKNKNRQKSKEEIDLKLDEKNIATTYTIAENAIFLDRKFKTTKEINEFYSKALDSFLEESGIPEEQVINAIVHHDQTTAHMHLTISNFKYRKSISHKKDFLEVNYTQHNLLSNVINNMRDLYKQDYTKWLIMKQKQKDFYNKEISSADLNLFKENNYDYQLLKKVIEKIDNKYSNKDIYRKREDYIYVEQIRGFSHEDILEIANRRRTSDEYLKMEQATILKYRATQAENDIDRILFTSNYWRKHEKDRQKGFEKNANYQNTIMNPVIANFFKSIQPHLDEPTDAKWFEKELKDIIFAKEKLKIIEKTIIDIKNSKNGKTINTSYELAINLHRIYENNYEKFDSKLFKEAKSFQENQKIFDLIYWEEKLIFLNKQKEKFEKLAHLYEKNRYLLINDKDLTRQKKNLYNIEKLELKAKEAIKTMEQRVLNQLGQDLNLTKKPQERDLLIKKVLFERIDYDLSLLGLKKRMDKVGLNQIERSREYNEKILVYCNYKQKQREIQYKEAGIKIEKLNERFEKNKKNSQVFERQDLIEYNKSLQIIKSGINYTPQILSEEIYNKTFKAINFDEIKKEMKQELSLKIESIKEEILDRHGFDYDKHLSNYKKNESIPKKEEIMREYDQNRRIDVNSILNEMWKDLSFILRTEKRREKIKELAIQEADRRLEENYQKKEKALRQLEKEDISYEKYLLKEKERILEENKKELNEWIEYEINKKEMELNKLENFYKIEKQIIYAAKGIDSLELNNELSKEKSLKKEKEIEKELEIKIEDIFMINKEKPENNQSLYEDFYEGIRKEMQREVHQNLDIVKNINSWYKKQDISQDLEKELKIPEISKNKPIVKELAKEGKSIQEKTFKPLNIDLEFLNSIKLDKKIENKSQEKSFEQETSKDLLKEMTKEKFIKLDLDHYIEEDLSQDFFPELTEWKGTKRDTLGQEIIKRALHMERVGQDSTSLCESNNLERDWIIARLEAGRELGIDALDLENERLDLYMKRK